jgi:Mn-dependent DtxR family transcriptional regulator
LTHVQLIKDAALMKAALDPHARRVLRVLYELAELNVAAEADLVARALGLSDVTRVMRELDARGLVDAQRTRLTMPGLALAARVPSLHLARETWLSTHFLHPQRVTDRQVS